MAPGSVRRIADLVGRTSGTVRVAGWVEDIRNLGSIAFVILRMRDGTLQLTLKKKEGPEVFKAATGVARESVLTAEGEIRPNEEVRNGFEILPTSIEVVSRAETPLPLGVVDKVGADLDTRLDNRFLDLRKPDRRAIFACRSLLIEGIRSSLLAEGFVEVATPKLSGAGAEGGATLFQTDYFGRRAYLSQSPQLYKQVLMGTGLDRVFEFAPAFRAEPSDTVRHATEFLSFDAELAFIDSQEDVLRALEGCVAAGLRHVAERGRDHLESLGARIEIPSLPVKRLPYAEALEICRANGKVLRDGDDLDTEAEKLVGEVMTGEGHPMFYVVEYPTAIKPFYIMAKDDEPEVSWSFDLEWRGDEMASGGQREHRYDHLVARMRQLGLNPDSFEFYLKAFRFGMPPHGGWGLGLDRLVQKMLGLPNIREATLFPRDRNRLSP